MLMCVIVVDAGGASSGGLSNFREHHKGATNIQYYYFTLCAYHLSRK